MGRGGGKKGRKARRLGCEIVRGRERRLEGGDGERDGLERGGRNRRVGVDGIGGGEVRSLWGAGGACSGRF